MNGYLAVYAIACVAGLAISYAWFNFREAGRKLDAVINEHWWTCLAGHKCLKPEYGGSPWCTTCTNERLMRSRVFQRVCACPQCAYVDDHPWDAVSYIDEDGNVATREIIVRRCTLCNFEWRQS